MLGAHYHPSFEGVLRKALSKDPADRYQNAVELYHDLTAVIKKQRADDLKSSLAGFMKETFQLELSHETERSKHIAHMPQFLPVPLKAAARTPSFFLFTITLVLATFTLSWPGASYTRARSYLLETRMAPPQKTTYPKKPVPKCVTRVYSRPAGARVTLSSRFLGQTPLSIVADCGSSLQLRLEGRDSKPLIRTIRADKSQKETTFILKPKRAQKRGKTRFRSRFAKSLE